MPNKNFEYSCVGEKHGYTCDECPYVAKCDFQDDDDHQEDPANYD